MFDEAEEIVLGCIIRGALSAEEASKTLQPENFLKAPTRHVYEAMLALHKRKEPVDIMTVPEQLARQEQPEGMEYVDSLVHYVPVERPAFYVGVVRDRSAWAHRKMS